MGQKSIKIYVASNVGIDYFFFLAKTIKTADYNVEPIYLISEAKYRKLSKSSGLEKIWLRTQMYFLYPFYLIYIGLKSKSGSIFVVSSNTFYAPYIVHFFLRFKGVKVIHMLYDLFPDAIEISGLITKGSFFSRMIGKIASKNQATCDGTVYLGDFLKKHTENRWGKSNISKVIDISTDLSLYSTNFEPLGSSGKLIIHYGGQLGHLHDANSIIESIKYVCQSDIKDQIEFNFYVSGSQAQFLEESLRGYPVTIISAVPSLKWREDIKNFHIGLVSLSPGGATVCLPSKTYGMMAGGMAILAICPHWSDLATLVVKLDAGWIVNNSVYTSELEFDESRGNKSISDIRSIELVKKDFYEVLNGILQSRSLLDQKRRNSFDGVRKNYNISNLSEKWDNLISIIKP
jgi:hypothetical protein